MDNYKNYHPDADDTMFCNGCGAKIEEEQIAGEGTEYEHPVKLCERCFKGATITTREVAIL